MKINGTIVNSIAMRNYKDATDYFASNGYAITDNFSFSIVLDPNSIYQSFTDEFNDKRYFLNVEVPELANKYILINADLVPIRNISTFPGNIHRYCGIIKITPDGKHYQVMWGFAVGAKPTKYLEQHLVIHNELQKRDPSKVALANVSSAYFQQFSLMDKENDENKYTAMLWDSYTDLARLVPNGIGLIPLTPAPSKEATQLFKDKFTKYNLVVRDKMNAMVAGKDWGEAISIASALDRASSNALAVGAVNTDKRFVSKQYLNKLEKEFNIKLNPDVVALAPDDADTIEAK